MPNERLDELHMAMGEFLTENAHLENIVFSLALACQLNDRTFEDIHSEYLDMTFGIKIAALKKICSEYNFKREHQVHIDKGLAQLDAILPKRNFIVHGVTFEIGRGDAQPIAYRIGAPKKNIDYMNAFLSNASVEHLFTADQVRKTTKDCVACRAELAAVVVELFTATARKQS
jgi:hypothetical protein